MTYLLTFRPISDRAARRVQSAVEAVDADAVVMAGWEADRSSSRQPGYVACPDHYPATLQRQTADAAFAALPASVRRAKGER